MTWKSFFLTGLVGGKIYSIAIRAVMLLILYFLGWFYFLSDYFDHFSFGALFGSLVLSRVPLLGSCWSDILSSWYWEKIMLLNQFCLFWFGLLYIYIQYCQAACCMLSPGFTYFFFSIWSWHPSVILSQLMQTCINFSPWFYLALRLSLRSVHSIRFAVLCSIGTK